MRIQLLVLLLVLLTSSCSSDCSEPTDNEILSTNSYTSNDYQAEMVRLLSGDHGEMEYFFINRESLYGDSYIVVQCKGDGLCGKLMLFINKEDQMSKKLQNNAGYAGAELKGLGMTPLSRKNPEMEMVMIYEGMEAIID